MPDFRPIMLVVGILLIPLGVAMLVPAWVDLANDSPDWMAFAGAAFLTLFTGGALWFANQGPVRQLTLQQAFLVITLSWVALVAFAAVPFRLSALGMTYADSFFEAMSGLTTTGSTVIVGLDQAPRGILIWRAILQWLGGIGIIVMAIAVLPMLQVGGMQIFRLESSDTSEKIVPRATEFAGSIAGLYVAISFFCFAAYAMTGMGAFDAVAHAMTTIATGGFSTHDLSIAHFQDARVEWIATFFMLASSLPFALYLLALNGKADLLWRDSQVRAFLAIAGTFILVMTLHVAVYGIAPVLDAPRLAAFNVVSVMTGTGYASTDYNAWGPFAVGAFFFIMFFGGCAGGTACGIKTFRFQLLMTGLNVQIKRILHPHGVFITRYAGRPVTEDVHSSVMIFFFFFLILFAVLALLLSFAGLDDPLTAMSAAGTAISNVGPGLGPEIGPTGTFKNVPETAKWLLSAGMLLGRLEIFTVLVIFTPAFWRG